MIIKMMIHPVSNANYDDKSDNDNDGDDDDGDYDDDAS